MRRLLYALILLVATAAMAGRWDETLTKKKAGSRALEVVPSASVRVYYDGDVVRTCSPSPCSTVGVYRVANFSATDTIEVGGQTATVQSVGADTITLDVAVTASTGEYILNTANVLTIYSDPNLTTTITQPATADDSGRLWFYWDTGVNDTVDIRILADGVLTILPETGGAGGGGSGDITQVYNCASGSCTSMSVANGQGLNFSACIPDGGGDCLVLPQDAGSSCLTSNVEGQICWDGTNDALHVGTSTQRLILDGLPFGYIDASNARYTGGMKTTNTGAQNRAALQTAINTACTAGGIPVMVRAGTYDIEQVGSGTEYAIYIGPTCDDVQVIGAGKGATVLRGTATGIDDDDHLNNDENIIFMERCTGCGVSHMTITATTSSVWDNGIRADGVQWGIFEHLLIADDLTASPAAGFENHGITLRYDEDAGGDTCARYNLVRNVEAVGDDSSIIVYGDSNMSGCTNEHNRIIDSIGRDSRDFFGIEVRRAPHTIIRGGSYFDNFHSGINIEDDSPYTKISGVSATGNGQHGLYINGSVTYRGADVVVTNSSFENNTFNGIVCDRSDRITISNTNMSGNGTNGYNDEDSGSDCGGASELCCNEVKFDGIRAHNNAKYGLQLLGENHFIHGGFITDNDVGGTSSDSAGVKLQVAALSKVRIVDATIRDNLGDESQNNADLSVNRDFLLHNFRIDSDDVGFSLVSDSSSYNQNTFIPILKAPHARGAVQAKTLVQDADAKSPGKLVLRGDPTTGNTERFFDLRLNDIVGQRSTGSLKVLARVKNTEADDATIQWRNGGQFTGSGKTDTVAGSATPAWVWIEQSFLFSDLLATDTATCDYNVTDLCVGGAWNGTPGFDVRTGQNVTNFQCVSNGGDCVGANCCNGGPNIGLDDESNPCTVDADCHVCATAVDVHDWCQHFIVGARVEANADDEVVDMDGYMIETSSSESSLFTQVDTEQIRAASASNSWLCPEGEPTTPYCVGASGTALFFDTDGDKDKEFDINFGSVGANPRGGTWVGATYRYKFGGDLDSTTSFGARDDGSQVNWWRFDGSEAGAPVMFYPAGSSGDVNVSVRTQPKGTGTYQVHDGDGDEVAHFDQVAGTPVNYLQLVNAITATGPELNAAGDDANIDVEINPKGTGKLVVGGDGTSAGFTGNGTNDPWLDPNGAARKACLGDRTNGVCLHETGSALKTEGAGNILVYDYDRIAVGWCEDPNTATAPAAGEVDDAYGADDEFRPWTRAFSKSDTVICHWEPPWDMVDGTIQFIPVANVIDNADPPQSAGEEVTFQLRWAVFANLEGEGDETMDGAQTVLLDDHASLVHGDKWSTTTWSTALGTTSWTAGDTVSFEVSRTTAGTYTPDVGLAMILLRFQRAMVSP